MADYTKTITNAIGLFGVEVSTKWGDLTSPYTMVWGTSKWGYGSNTIIFDIIKGVSNAQVMTSTVSKEAVHYYGVDPLYLESAIIKEKEKFVSNDLGLSEDMYSEKLSREGWDYVFPPGTNEGENRISTSWSQASTSTVSYTCQPAGSTVWT